MRPVHDDDRRSVITASRSRTAPFLLLALAIARLPGFVFGVVDCDESDLVVIGRMLGHGAIPYVDFVEKKPPLLYLFYSPAALFGFHMWPMQLLALLWLWATCLVIGAAARRWSGREDVGVAAAWLCAAIACCNVLSVNAELLLDLPAAGALYCFVRRETGGSTRDDLATGLCIGAATLFKHQAGILLPAFALAILWRPDRTEALRRMVAMTIGVALPWLAVVLVYLGLGHLAELWEWNVLRNFLYAGYGAGSPLARFVESTLFFVVLAAPLPWLLAMRSAPSLARSPLDRGLGIALASIWIPVSLGGRFYGHYFLQFAPALALLAAPALVTAIEKGKRVTKRNLLLAIAAPVACFAIFHVARGLLGTYPAQEPRTRAVAAWLRAHTRPDDRLFIWGHYTPIYYLAQRLPGTRYYNTSVHMGDFDPHHLPPTLDITPYRSQRDVALTLRDLDANRPAIVVDTAPADIHEWSKVPLSKFPELAAYLERHYRRIAVVAGAPIYGRSNE